MIDIETSIHDAYSIEVKVGFKTKKIGQTAEFDINTWFFIPNSLDINASTYTKDQFYSDVKSKVRFITPIYLLKEIVDNGAVPLNNLRSALNDVLQSEEDSSELLMEYEFQLKMFMAIFRSAIRNHLTEIKKCYQTDDLEVRCLEFASAVENISIQFRGLRELLVGVEEGSETRNYYDFADEYLSYAIVHQVFGFLELLEGEQYNLSEKVRQHLIGLITREKEYMKIHNYLDIKKGDRENNQKVVYRHTMLDKYIESDLALISNKRKDEDGVIAQQIYYSLAAGLSMIFATIIAFSFQQKYGNFTMPLFVALVISYMLKDRIKELMRYYFIGKLGGKYFDNKTNISVKDQKIGWIKESVDFIAEEKVPEEVLNLRDRSALLEIENKIHNEKIMLYRKKVHLDNKKVIKESTYAFDGINDIIHFNLTRLTQRMNNPYVTVYTLDQNDLIGEPERILADKIYYLNFIAQIKYENIVDYKRFRIVCKRTGIEAIEELSLS
ncbi:hypothetical protein HX045_06020 [Myroides odoratimimus]|uniref:Uncharacterized protein n=1 Tax=Myroides odoratimimus TaxID=76832 RepID=A0AAI8G5C1_9FLAO|nr:MULTISPECIES: hypothetical protein [Myroides]ALU27122.1 hypothetical protein AS202_13575 [Myroides odoratimimus]APA93145.1 hypothetical protein BK054_13125 [Myroides sp. ZB35]MCA4792243.1 hypothetical protein [Myroides odoratimimus]MCA4806241.1 hypothetical protein [Myroides odoratimimus]MCA4819504.1 hypothetical protein [Myroides odoratimimus]